MERLHALFLEMAAKWVEAKDAETLDADLEPSLGAPEYPDHLNAIGPHLGRKLTDWSRGGATDDRETDGGAGSDKMSDADAEPSLGAPEGSSTLHLVTRSRDQNKRGRFRRYRESNLDQTRWARGSGDEEDEPSLCATHGPLMAEDGKLRWRAGREDGDRSLRDLDLEEQEENGETGYAGSDDEPDVDDEPSLASLSSQEDQRRWAAHDEGWITIDGEPNGDEQDFSPTGDEA